MQIHTCTAAHTYLTTFMNKLELSLCRSAVQAHTVASVKLSRDASAGFMLRYLAFKDAQAADTALDHLSVTGKTVVFATDLQR